MAFIVYKYDDYKKALKERVRYLKKQKPKYSLQYLANTLKIQYTFLSKVLNSPSHHLSEDQVFTAATALDFLEDEVEFLLCLRSFQSTQKSSRRDLLFRKISNIQRRHRLSTDMAEPSTEASAQEMKYLMDHQAVIVHTALSIKSILNHPQSLSTYLGIDLQRLTDILILLDQLGRIEFDAKEFTVKKVLRPRLHIGKDHPLMRLHQLTMKIALNQMSFAKPEMKKENFFATLTTDQVGFEKIKVRIKSVLTEIQQLSFEHSHQGVYQLNVDFVELFSSLNKQSQLED